MAAILEPVFPVMYKWYADSQIGTVFLENSGSSAVTDVVARVSVPRHVEGAIDSERVETVAPGEVVQIPLPVLFDEAAVLAITEGRTAAATVEIAYETKDEQHSLSRPYRSNSTIVTRSAGTMIAKQRRL